ncbi:hypothetical protein DE146DRAFT_757506 [Phaeosphaeria sp. MPI-PUGE-AT-0046c]|nr:hypothetical protein DE146DRAFT_757506 [Phaeosphaeria sp. MPI-PUGE-AT-0046c]
MSEKHKHTPSSLPFVGGPHTSLLSTHPNQLFENWYKILHSPILPEHEVTDQPASEHAPFPSAGWHNEVAREAMASNMALSKPETVESDPAHDDFITIPGNITRQDGNVSYTMSVDRVRAKLARRRALRKKQLKRASRLDPPLETLLENSSSLGEDNLDLNETVPSSPRPAFIYALSRSQPISKPTPWSGPPSPPRPVNENSRGAKNLEAFRRRFRDGGPFSPLKPSYKTYWPSKDNKLGLDGPISPLTKRLRKKQPDIVPSFRGLIEVVDKNTMPPFKELLEFDGLAPSLPSLPIQSKRKAKAKRKCTRRTQLELLLEAAGPNHEMKMRTRREEYCMKILDVLMDREAGCSSDDE